LTQYLKNKLDNKKKKKILDAEEQVPLDTILQNELETKKEKTLDAEEQVPLDTLEPHEPLETKKYRAYLKKKT
jgi:hypothetical protein